LDDLAGFFRSILNVCFDWHVLLRGLGLTILKQQADRTEMESEISRLREALQTKNENADKQLQKTQEQDTELSSLKQQLTVLAADKERSLNTLAEAG
jgi:septal ring factor EnvC (AmiA/AmiB activator)